MNERKKKGMGGKKGRSTSNFWADLQHQGIWHLKQWSNEKPCVQVMSLIFFSAPICRSAASSFLLWGLWESDWWVMGKVVWYRQGPLQMLSVSSLQTSAANFPLDPGIDLSCCRHSCFGRHLFACSSAYRNKGRWGSAEKSVLNGKGRFRWLRVYICICREIDGQVEKCVGW